jgi:hypothetical protein
MSRLEEGPRTLSGLKVAALLCIGPANGAEELLRDEPNFMVSTACSEAAPKRPPLVHRIGVTAFYANHRSRQ